MGILHSFDFEGAIGDGWDLVTGTPAIDTGVFRTGAQSAYFNCTGSAKYLQNDLTSKRQIAARFYLRLHTAASGSASLFVVNGTVSMQLQLRPGAKIRANVGAVNSADSAALTLDTWYRIDFYADASTGTHTVDWQLDGVDQAGASEAHTAADFTNLRLGNTGSNTYQAYIDDVQINDATADFPIGAGPASLPANLVQQAVDDSAGTSLVITLGASPTAGNILVLCAGADSAGITGVSGGGATWAKAAGGFGFWDCEIWLGTAISGGGSAAITVTMSASGNSSGGVSEWSGVSGLDTSGTRASATGPLVTSASVTPSADNATVVACFYAGAHKDGGPPSPYAGLTDALAGASGEGLYSAAYVLPTAGATTTTWAIATAGGYDAVTVALAASVAAGVSDPLGMSGFFGG